MPSESDFAKRRYENTPFILSNSKITRVVEVARERLERFSGDMPISEEFVVSFKKNNKMLKVDSLQKVLQLDNSVNNPIQEIAINLLCFPELPDKGGVIRLIFSGASRTISLVVGSPDVVWMQETMGSLEEQVAVSYTHLDVYKRQISP